MRKAGQESRLGYREVDGILVEVRAGGRLYAVGVGAEVDRVQVHVENLVLGVLALHLPSQGHLVELAAERDVGAVEVEVADQLHGDGREALVDSLGPDVGDQGADEPLQVHAGVAVEALVFYGHQGVPHDVGDLFAADDRAVLFAVEIGEQGAVGGVDLGGLGQRHVALRLERRQVLLDGGHGVQPEKQRPGQDADRDQRDGDQHRDEDDGAAAPHRLGTPLSGATSFSADLHMTSEVVRLSSTVCRRFPKRILARRRFSVTSGWTWLPARACPRGGPPGS